MITDSWIRAARSILAISSLYSVASGKIFISIRELMGYVRLFGGARFLIASVHEGAWGALGTQVGVVDGRAGLVGGEAAGEQGVGLELGRPAVELACVAQDHSGAAVHGLDDAAHLDIHVAVLAQFAHVLMILPEADDGETAGVVGGLRRAYVEEARAIGKLNHIINMGGNANVFLEHFGGLVGGDAGLGRGGHGGEWREEDEKDRDRQDGTTMWLPDHGVLRGWENPSPVYQGRKG